MAAATEARPATAGRSKTRRFGPDRVTIAVGTGSAFLFLLAVLAARLPPGSAPAGHRTVLIRRIYQPRVVQTIQGPGGAGGTGGTNGSSVTQSVSSSGAAAASAPTTRASG